jgi:hypothetical protein
MGGFKFQGPVLPESEEKESRESGEEKEGGGEGGNEDEDADEREHGDGKDKVKCNPKVLQILVPFPPLLNFPGSNFQFGNKPIFY